MPLDANGARASPDRSPTIACDLLAMSGGWSPVVHSARAVGRQGALRRREGVLRAREHRGAGRNAPPALPTAASSLGDCLAEGDAAGTAAARRAGFTARRSRRFAPTVADVVEEPLVPLWVVPSPTRHRPRAEAVRRSAERRRRVRHRARRARRLSLDRARQALHGDGLRHRPGQARQHQRHWRSSRRRSATTLPSTGTTTFRPNYTPVTFGAIAGPDLGDRFDPDPQDRAPRVARRARRALRERRAVEAAVVLPEGRRGPPCRRRARMSRRAQRRGHHGCVDARQDRHPGAGRRDAPQLGVHQRLGQARGRPLPLRPDARRERHGDRRRRHHAPRRAPFPDDHHDRRRGARDGVARALAADRMAAPQGVPHVRDRSLGDRQRWSAPTAATC